MVLVLLSCDVIRGGHLQECNTTSESPYGSSGLAPRNLHSVDGGFHEIVDNERNSDIQRQICFMYRIFINIYQHRS